MPYKLRKAPKRDLYWVVNTETKKKHSNEPLPKDKAEAQMRALYAAESKTGKGREATVLHKLVAEKNMAAANPQHFPHYIVEEAKQDVAAEAADPTMGHKRRKGAKPAVGPSKLRTMTKAAAPAPAPPAAKPIFGGPGSAFKRMGNGKRVVRGKGCTTSKPEECKPGERPAAPPSRRPSGPSRRASQVVPAVGALAEEELPEVPDFEAAAAAAAPPAGRVSRQPSFELAPPLPRSEWVQGNKNVRQGPLSVDESNDWFGNLSSAPLQMSKQYLEPTPDDEEMYDPDVEMEDRQMMLDLYNEKYGQFKHRTISPRLRAAIEDYLTTPVDAEDFWVRTKKVATQIAAAKQAYLDESAKRYGSGKKWIQKVVKARKFKEGAFTRQALAHDMTPKQFAKKVMAHPEDFSTTTRHRAQFLMNILPKDIEGSGFFSNLYDTIKRSVSGVSALATKGIRKGYSPSAKSMLDKYAQGQIVELAVRRDPVQAFIDIALNAITLGKWAQAKSDLSYDKLFHLGLVIGVKIAGRRTNLIVEKNEVVNIAVAKRPNADTQFFHIPLNGKQMTFGSFMDNAQQAMGTEFFLYDAFENNCQDFVLNLLKANGMLDENAATFIKQPVDVLIRKLPFYTQGVARKVTDLGAAANVVLEGGLHALLEGAGVGHVFQTRFSPETGFFHRPFEHMYGAGDSPYMQYTRARDAGFVGSYQEWAKQDPATRAATAAHEQRAASFVNPMEERNKRAAAWNAEMRRREQSPFAPIVSGLVKAGDFAVGVGEKFGLPKAVSEAYKTFAPPGSQYYRPGSLTDKVVGRIAGGKGDIVMKRKDYVAEHKKLIGLMNKTCKEGKEQAAELKRMTGGALAQTYQTIVDRLHRWGPNAGNAIAGAFIAASAAEQQQLNSIARDLDYENFNELMGALGNAEVRGRLLHAMAPLDEEEFGDIMGELEGGQTHRLEFLKRNKLKDKSYSLAQLSKISKVPKEILQQVYNRGIGAYKTQPQSVRLKGSYVKNVDAPMSAKLSKEQWGMARVYSFLQGNPKHDNDLRRNKLSGGGAKKDEIVRLMARHAGNRQIAEAGNAALRLLDELESGRKYDKKMASLWGILTGAIGALGAAAGPGVAVPMLFTGATSLHKFRDARDKAEQKQAIVDAFRETIRLADELEEDEEDRGVAEAHEAPPRAAAAYMPRAAAAPAAAAAAAAAPEEEEEEEAAAPRAAPGKIKKEFAPVRPRGGAKGIVFRSLEESNQAGKKWRVNLTVDGRSRTIHFGAAGMDDFTKTGDKIQKKRYIERHGKRENWTKSGITTPGFWSRWVLWNKPTVAESLADVRKRFKL